MKHVWYCPTIILNFLFPPGLIIKTLGTYTSRHIGINTHLPKVVSPNTGKDNNSKTAVTKTDHANNGIWSKSIPNTRKFPRVLIKFTAPKIDLTPAKCSEKIAKSTEPPACAIFLDSGG